MKTVRAVIFDMDGTILNTVEDLTASVNYAMDQCGHRHDFTGADGRRMFGSGAHTALQRALAMEAGEQDDASLRRIGTPDMMTVPGVDEEEVSRIEAVFRPHYLVHSMDRTGPYDGIMDLLHRLRRMGIRTAVVSNKPDPAVKKLAADCFEGLFDAAMGEQAGIRRKPAPDMTVAALRALGVPAADAIYLGDTEIDVAAAASAQMECVCVSWGFRPRAFLEGLRPLAIIDRPQDLLQVPGLTFSVS